MAGDILLHPALWDQAEKDGAGKLDFSPLLAGIAPYLAESDLALCNLETPVAAPGGPYGGYPMFIVPPQIIGALKEVGYDGCTTASNHSMDAGVSGVKRTLDAHGRGRDGSHRFLPQRRRGEETAAGAGRAAPRSRSSPGPTR